jgi:hypothetical protein
VKSVADLHLNVADLVWVATALLHREHPERADFSNDEIRRRAAQEDPEGANRPGIATHISSHCVASKEPLPAKHRMLTRTRNGRRRLFRRGDRVHPLRSDGHTTPPRENLPEKYHYLIDWYEAAYNKPAGEDPAGKPLGATAETLMKMIGRISREDADELIRAIDEGCGGIDANEW